MNFGERRGFDPTQGEQHGKQEEVIARPADTRSSVVASKDGRRWLPSPYERLLDRDSLVRTEKGIEVHIGEKEDPNFSRIGVDATGVYEESTWHSVMKGDASHGTSMQRLNAKNAEKLRDSLVAYTGSVTEHDGKTTQNHDLHITRDEDNRVTEEHYKRTNEQGDTVLEVHTTYEYDAEGNPVSKHIQFTDAEGNVQEEDAQFVQHALPHLSTAVHHMGQLSKWRSFPQEWGFDGDKRRVEVALDAIERQKQVDQS